jgi:hypothetical protein
MKKLVLSIFQPPDGKGSPHAVISCVDETGNIDRAVVNTLLDVVRELSERERNAFRMLIEQVKSGRYDQMAFTAPSWAGNACSVWFGNPVAGPYHVLIANQYVTEYSEDEGRPQKFTVQQLEIALNAWSEFVTDIGRFGKETMAREVKEVEFPLS